MFDICSIFTVLLIGPASTARRARSAPLATKCRMTAHWMNRRLNTRVSSRNLVIQRILWRFVPWGWPRIAYVPFPRRFALRGFSQRLRSHKVVERKAKWLIRLKMIPILAIFVILKWVGNRRMMSTAKCGGCEKCGDNFCSKCFIDRYGKNEYMKMMQSFNQIYCPKC